MATYRVTGPDGSTYNVTPPEGTNPSEAEILAQVQQHVGAVPVAGTVTKRADLPGGRQSELRGPEPLWHKLYSEGLPLVGMAGGGALGGVGGGGILSPPAAATGAILGYTGGRQAVRLIDEVMRRFGRYPYGQGPSAARTAGEIGKDVVAATGMEALPMLPGAARAGFQRLAGSELATPEREAVLAAARKQGIPLTVGAESGSRTASAIQRVPELALFGGRSIPAAREATRTGAEQAVERVIAKEGGPVTTESGGSAVKLDIRQRLERARERFAKGVGQRQAGIAERMESAKSAAEAQRVARQGQYDMAIQQHQRDVEADVERVAEALGGVPKVGPRSLGTVVKGGLKGVEQEARKSSSALYDQAFAVGGKDSPVSLSTTRAGAEKMGAFLDRLAGTGPSGVSRAAVGLQRAATGPEAKDLPEALQATIRMAEAGQMPGSLARTIIEQYGLNKVGTRTLEETVAIQQAIGAKMSRAPDRVTKRYLGQLKAMLEKDLEAFATAKGGEYGALIKQAIAYNAREVQADFSKKALLARAMGTEPGMLGKRLIGMHDGDLVARTMARLPPAEAEQVRRTTFERLVQNATKDGEVDPAKLDLELSRIPPETRQALFGSSDRELSALQLRLRAVAPKRDQAEALLTKANQQAAVATKQQLDTLKAEQAKLPKALAIPRDVEKTMGLTTDRVIQELTHGKAGNVGELPRVWRMLTPKTKQEVRQSLVTSWLDQAKKGPGGIFSTERFATEARKVPDSVRAIILHEEPRQALREIEMVLNRINRFDKATANPSGTSQALTSTFEVLRAVTRTAEVGVGLLSGVMPRAETLAASGALVVGPGLIGRAMTSRWARTLFTVQGLNAIPSSQRPAAVVLRILLTPAAQRLEGGRVGAIPMEFTMTAPASQETTP